MGRPGQRATASLQMLSIEKADPGANNIFRVPLPSMLFCLFLFTWVNLELQRIVADTLGLGDEELDARLLQLQSILPNLVQKWPQMKPELLAALAANPG